MNIYITACVAQLSKSSDTQSVGHVFEPRPPDDVRTIN